MDTVDLSNLQLDGPVDERYWQESEKYLRAALGDEEYERIVNEPTENE